MNALVLKELTQEYVIYLYQPEGKGSQGEIHMNFKDDKASVVLRSDNDSSLGSYAFKAAKAVKECVKEQKFPPEFTQAWY